MGFGGVSLRYWTKLLFLNERNGFVFVGLYTAAFTLLGGPIAWIIATLFALIATVALQRFVLNPIQPIPKGSAILITGCSSGFGQRAAIDFAQKRITVFATVRKESDKVALLDLIPAEYKQYVVPVLLDVTKDTDIDNAVQYIKTYLSSSSLNLISVVNNAGYGQYGFMETTSVDLMKKQLDTNVYGAIYLTQAFLPLLRSNLTALHSSSSGKLKPSVIFISSVMGQLSGASGGIYAMSKFALEAAADAFRQELLRCNINVSIVEPGLYETDFNKTGIKTFTTLPSHLDNETDYNIKEYYTTAVDNVNKSVPKQLEKAQDPCVFTDLLLEIILTPKPLDRYAMGMDSQIILTLNRYLPRNFLDSLTSSDIFPWLQANNKDTLDTSTVDQQVAKPVKSD